MKGCDLEKTLSFYLSLGVRPFAFPARLSHSAKYGTCDMEGVCRDNEYYDYSHQSHL